MQLGIVSKRDDSGTAKSRVILMPISSPHAIPMTREHPTKYSATPPTPPNWDLYRNLREQWPHEDLERQ
jgi:hypothetical protein